MIASGRNREAGPAGFAAGPVGRTALPSGVAVPAVPSVHGTQSRVAALAPPLRNLAGDGPASPVSSNASPNAAHAGKRRRRRIKGPTEPPPPPWTDDAAPVPRADDKRRSVDVEAPLRNFSPPEQLETPFEAFAVQTPLEAAIAASSRRRSRNHADS
ncbi:hypothetical protein M885DRAFT_516346 [Pelagophyceae sp. CCMP2097]|nr:hypothetical protein M885DRAFT_516346 [Pelagophyceae sp. CCMP2097]